jgi:hypothetical protein
LFCVCVRMQSNGERTAQMDEEYEIDRLLNALRRETPIPDIVKIFEKECRHFIAKCEADGVAKKERAA